MFLTPPDQCFTMTIKPSGFRGFRWVALFLALAVVFPAEGAAVANEGFDKVRLAPNVEFLDGTALDLLVGTREGSAPAEEANPPRSGSASEPAAGQALSDLLGEGESDSDLENVSWSDAEGDPTGSAASPPDDLGTLEDILDLEDLEPPAGDRPETREAQPSALNGPAGI